MVFYKIINLLQSFFKHLYNILNRKLLNKGNLMETNLVLEGFKFMGLGMGTVFLFLVIMIASMNIMSTVIHRFFPEPHASEASDTSVPASQEKDNSKVIAAITAAIAHHRQG